MELNGGKLDYNEEREIDDIKNLIFDKMILKAYYHKYSVDILNDEQKEKIKSEFNSKNIRALQLWNKQQSQVLAPKFYCQKQESLGCGRHALNNFLQNTVFIKGNKDDKLNFKKDSTGKNIDLYLKNNISLSAICYHVFYLLSRIGIIGNFDSFCDINENYDYNVLMASLGFLGYEVNSSSNLDNMDKNDLGYIYNQGGHWIAVKKINDDKYRIIDSIHCNSSDNKYASNLTFEEMKKYLQNELKLMNKKESGKTLIIIKKYTGNFRDLHQEQYEQIFGKKNNNNFMVTLNNTIKKHNLIGVYSKNYKNIDINSITNIGTYSLNAKYLFLQLNFSNSIFYDLKERLGNGGYGFVDRFESLDNVSISVKNNSLSDIDAYLKEKENYEIIKKNNICKDMFVESKYFIYFDKISQKTSYLTIMEYMDGNIYQLKKDYKYKGYNFALSLKLIKIISGQIYCFFKENMIYTDIKYLNSLYKINSDGSITVKLGDLGSFQNEYCIMTYTPIEREKELFKSYKCDEKDVVYMLSILFMTLLPDFEPFKDTGIRNDKYYSLLKNIYYEGSNLFSHINSMQIDSIDKYNLKDIFRKALEVDPKSRIGIQEFIELINNFYDSYFDKNPNMKGGEVIGFTKNDYLSNNLKSS